MQPIRISDLFGRDAPAGPARIQGWVKTRRTSRTVSFVQVNDGSTLRDLQVVVDQDSPAHAVAASLSTGCSVAVDGEIVESQGKGQRYEMRAAAIRLIGGADPESYPLQKKRHTPEFLREIAHLRPRTNTFGAMARVRSAAAYAIHSFFQQRGFQYIQTPIITASDAEGAGSMFRVTTLDLDDPPRRPAANGRLAVDAAEDFFGRPAFLTVSGQLEAEIFAMALSNVYTFGPTFRAENSNTSRHLAEFWMVEPEVAFCELDGLAELAEDFLKHIFAHILTHCAEDMAFFNQWHNPQTIANLESIINAPFERITYTEAVSMLTQSGESFAFPVHWGADLQSEHERYLTEKRIGRPVIVTDYPREIKAFYMRINDDDRTVRAMDVLAPGIGEIIGGSQREERRDILERRMTESGLNPDDYYWYLDLRRYGTVPHAGFGLGFERTVQFITGVANIRDVIPFPRTPKNAEF